MPNNGIYKKNNNNLKKIAIKEKKVFDCILKHKKGVIQAQIVAKTQIPQSTVARILHDMIDKTYVYGGRTYILTCENKEYKIIPQETLTTGVSEVASPKEKGDFEACFTEAVAVFKGTNLLKGTSQKWIDNVFVIYDIDNKKYAQIISYLKKLYGNFINQIFQDKNATYMILNNGDKLFNEVKRSLRKLYEQSIETEVDVPGQNDNVI